MTQLHRVMTTELSFEEKMRINQVEKAGDFGENGRNRKDQNTTGPFPDSYKPSGGSKLGKGTSSCLDFISMEWIREVRVETGKHVSWLLQWFMEDVRRILATQGHW